MHDDYLLFAFVIFLLAVGGFVNDKMQGKGTIT